MNESKDKSNKLDINISSKAIEKTFDTAKEFLDKLIMPSVEEVGLLIKGKVTYWRFKNQIKILTKARDVCQRNNISTKAISLKLLVPLLENASLEEDEYLQDKWAVLISNLVDSDQNIENHVFPYILSQISVSEFKYVEKIYIEKKQEKAEAKESYEKINKQLDLFEEKTKEVFLEIDNKISKLKKSSDGKKEEKIKQLQDKKFEIRREGHGLYKERNKLKALTNRKYVIERKGLKEFELSNLVRLGLAKNVYQVYSKPHTIDVPVEEENETVSVDFDIDLDIDDYNILTELGELFISACIEKSKK